MVSHCYQTNKCQRNSEEKLIMLKTDESPDKENFAKLYFKSLDHALCM